MSQPQVSVESNFANYSPKTISSVCFKESQFKVFCQELSSNHCAAIDEECRLQTWPSLCVQIDVLHTTLNGLLSKSRSWSLCIWSSHTERSTGLCELRERKWDPGPVCLVPGEREIKMLSDKWLCVARHETMIDWAITKLKEGKPLCNVHKGSMDALRIRILLSRS